MQAFAHASALSSRTSSWVGRRRSTCHTSGPRAKGVFRVTAQQNGPAGTEAEGVKRAVESGNNLREQLREISEARKEQAARTEKKLEEMSAQLEKLMERVRQETGLSPKGTSSSSPSGNGPDVSARASSPGKSPQTAAANAVASTSSDESDEQEPYTDPSTFGFDSTAGWQVLQSSDELPENGSEGNVQFRIECDMNGCSIIEMNADAPPGPGVRQKYVYSGNGFRVGYDPEAPKTFCGMVGNDQWLLALSVDEVRHFKRLCLAIKKKMERIERGDEDPPVKKPAVRRSGDGMFNERVGRTGSDFSVEFESKLLWVQGFGQPEQSQYGIRAIFMEGRQSEGYWAPDIVPNMLAAVAKLEVE